MDSAAVLRLISLVPDRMPRSQSGSRFAAASSARAQLLAPFLGWLGPLNPISKEEQQLLGVRTGGGKEAFDPVEIADEVDDTPIRLPEAGTQIAA
jgi:hypothetical protein